MTHYETKDIKAELDYSAVYSQQSLKPDWFDEVKRLGGIALCATSGSSPFNEWYGFRDRKQAIQWFTEINHSDSWHESFEARDGEIYDADGFPACLQSLVYADSRF